MVYAGIYALIYLHTILGEGIVSRDGLPRGVLPSGILKIEKYCPGLKVPVSDEMTGGMNDRADTKPFINLRYGSYQFVRNITIANEKY